jgi:hypothetical protein
MIKSLYKKMIKSLKIEKEAKNMRYFLFFLERTNLQSKRLVTN